jgi:hypothetical protein
MALLAEVRTTRQEVQRLIVGVRELLETRGSLGAHGLAIGRELVDV